jgi:hypothetical protein
LGARRFMEYPLSPNFVGHRARTTVSGWLRGAPLLY